jgi:uncharacterized membrane protein YidH (DUF202 family)
MPSQTDSAGTYVSPTGEHLSWVRTRMSLDADLLDAVRYGFSLIVAGFGSFSILEGLTIGERGIAELPRSFALIVTVIGVIIILAAILHFRKMVAWVDRDEFGDQLAPELPNEDRARNLGIAAVIIGLVSFVALLVAPA